MMIRRFLLLLTCMWSSLLFAADHNDVFVSKLIPPELIFQNRHEIELTEQQISSIQNHAESASVEAQQLQQRLQRVSQRMAEILSQDEVVEADAIAQLNKVFDVEAELKTLHFTTMLRVRSELTSDQQRHLLKLRKKIESKNTNPDSDKSIKARLQGKLARIQAEMESRTKDGIPPMDAAKTMQEFPQAMQEGRVKEAEAILDHVMEMLELSSKGTRSNKSSTSSESPVKQEPGPARVPAALLSIESMEPFSRAQLRSYVASLEDPNVGWRKVAWRTCLIDGLKRSKDQKKPLLLWVFIDRPIDDERC